MRQLLHPAVLVGALLLAGGDSIVRADTYSFDFNTLAATTSGSTAAAAATAISNYMTGRLVAQGCIGCSVSVVGAVADRLYSGEGHVVGPVGGTTTPIYTSLTLGNSDHAQNNNNLGGTVTSTTYDTFLSNTKDNNSSISSEFYMVFNLGAGIKITGASFDFEIFPDNAGPVAAPDMTLKAGNGTTGGSLVGGTDPAVASFGASGVQLGVTPGTTNGSNTHSPNSGSGAEPYKQWIGTWAGSLNNVTEIDFFDWPATIAIDNLTITTPVPEPGSMGLLAAALLFSGLAFSRKRITQS